MSNNKHTLVPKLRFPEFQNAGEWEEDKLGDLCEYWNGTSHENSVTDDGIYFLISLNSIDIDGNLKREMKKLSYTDNSLQKNDLVMVLSDVAHGNFLGLTDIIPNDRYVLNQRMAGLRIKDFNKVNPLFLRAFINKNQKYFKRQGQGSSQLNLSKSSVTEFQILTPPKLPEQQKIASCLSSLDEVITGEQQKLELLKQHKKGLLQNLFPQEGETVPKLRFKEFENSGEWEENKLSEIAEIKRGAASQHLNYVEKNHPNAIRLIRINDFLNDEAVYVEDTSDIKRFRVKTGDILIAGTGATAGITFIIDSKFNDLAYSYNAPRIRVEKANNQFVYQYLKSDSIIKQQKRLFVGNAQPFLDITTIGNFKLFIPSLPEQQKIASCLSSLDDLITAQTQKIEQLQRHKKGLLQGLFPNMNEHHG